MISERNVWTLLEYRVIDNDDDDPKDVSIDVL